MSDTFVHAGAGTGQVSYSIDDRQECVVVTVGGHVDGQNCPGLCDAVSVASEFSEGVAIDLTWAEFAEDVAIDLFVAALRRSTEENRVALVNPPPALRGWLKTGVLAAEVTVRDDVADAVHVVRASPLDLPRA